MNNFEKYLAASSIEIQKEIDATLMRWGAVVTTHTPSLKNETDLFTASFKGGKSLRGTLVKLGYEISGAKKLKEVIKVATAFEILHTSLLIHDDIIDKSPSRRGKKTLHTTFKNSHYGVSQALCLGDIGFFLSMQLFTDMRLASHFSQIILETIIGEMLDIKLASIKQKNETDIMTMQKLKTAYYSISGPLAIGAQLGKANAKTRKAIQSFGEDLGIAYQMQDDILGIFGDEKITGKSATSDIEENKNTLLISYALKKATSEQKKLLVKYYGKPLVTKAQQEIIKNIFKDTGALAYSQQKAQTYIVEAKKMIASITTSKKQQTHLYQFADFILNRKK